jgi:nitroimidazol reductase NimA-like FMN-containing flavoprotein (pyridoxamine 5'-phosphate oxidase superfamily)
MEAKFYPRSRVLEEDDIHSILGRNTVGRLAFCWNGRADIRPLHYVYSGGQLYGRTTVGAKFATTNGLIGEVAFEVDEVESMLRWKSVIVRGTFGILDADGVEAEEWKNASRLLRRVIRDAFGPDDPVPERDVLFRITIHEATGRASA